MLVLTMLKNAFTMLKNASTILKNAGTMLKNAGTMLKNAGTRVLHEPGASICLVVAFLNTLQRFQH